MNPLKSFEEKMQAAVARIGQPGDLRIADENVDAVLKGVESFNHKELDKYPPDILISMAGKLAARYFSLGQTAAYTRAERDLGELKADAVEKEIFLRLIDGKYKVTEVRAMVAGEMQEVREAVVQLERRKNEYESIVEAARLMIMLLQSGIKIKEGEKFITNRTQSQ